MNRLLLAAALWAAVSYTPARAVETKFWTEREQSDFEKGKLTNLSLRSDGRLTLAPTFREMFDSSVPYLWTLASDSKGNFYTAGGGPSASTARVFRIDAAGKSTPIAEVPGLEVHAIAVNRRDQVFAATAPDGKVYRIEGNGKAEVFYDPKAKYVWGMVFAPTGDLYLATGDKGEVHRVTPDGKGSVFFRTEETHARSITIDQQGNVIVGTEPGGLIVRISPAGEGFVLYQAPKREITAVAVARDGVVYAAAVGNKGVGGPMPPTVNFPAPQPVPSTAPGAPPRTEGAKPPATATPVPLPTLGREASVTGGSELYRIERDNYVRRIWSHQQDIAYAVGVDAQGRPVIGTGNRGNIYRVDSENMSTLLINSTPTQVTAFATTADGTLHAATGNIGKVFRIGPGSEAQGSFESEPFDVGGFSWWGRLSFHGEANSGKLAFETRSGNVDRPQKNWSNWVPVDLVNGARVNSPAARFLQYRVNMAAGPDGRSPELSEVQIAYMSKNVAPVVETIEATPPNYRTSATGTAATPPTQSLTLPPLGQRRRTLPAATPFEGSGASLTLQYGKGSIGARWTASDANGDDLVYKVEIRGTNESEWKLLREKVRERHLTWDSTAFPDGEYLLRVTASDAPDNPPDQALTGQLVGPSFLIDNTAPVVQNLTATRSGSKLTVRWRARDARSIVAKAEYSLNGGDWTVVEPTTRLSDAMEHEYTLTIDAATPGENTVAIRITDDFDNQVVDKAVVR